jgi:hypothetical protein
LPLARLVIGQLLQTAHPFNFLAAAVGALFTFGLVPLLDLLLGPDGVNPSQVQRLHNHGTILEYANYTGHGCASQTDANPFAPVAIKLSKRSDTAHPQAQLPGVAKDAAYKRVLHGYVALQLLACTSSYWFIATQHPSWAVMLGLLLSLSSVGAVGFTVAHDLIHSNRKVDQVLAMVQLSSMCYAHWSLSHVAHHTQVSTPRRAGPDPAYLAACLRHMTD